MMPCRIGGALHAGVRSPSKIAEANLRDDDGGPIFLPSPFLLSFSEAKSNDGTNGGRHIQNGFLMGGNHSPMIRMTL